MSESPYHPDRYRVSIKKFPAPRDKPSAPPGLVFSYFHDSLNEHDIFDVKAPSGKFYLNINENATVVLLSGGVGITLVLSMLNALVKNNSQIEIWFFWEFEIKQSML